MKSYMKKSLAILVSAGITVGLLAGCGQNAVSETGAESEKPAVVAAADDVSADLAVIDPEEVILSVEGVDVKAAALFYYYYSQKHGYESYYGITDWSLPMQEGYTYADYLKSNVESQVLNMAYLLSKTDQYDVELTEEELSTIDADVDKVIEMIDEEDLNRYGFTKDNLVEVDKDMIRCSKVLEAMLQEAQDGFTEEQLASCKFKKVQHILISTMDYVPETEAAAESETLSETEAKESESETEDPGKAAYMKERYALAEEVLKKAKDGEDFEALAGEYTADSGIGYSISPEGMTPDGNMMVTEFSDAANALKEGEISGIVETQYGYHIIKCVADEDPEAEVAAKENIAYATLQQKYNEWLDTVEYSFADVWKNYVVVNPPVKEEVVETEIAPVESEETEAVESEAVESEKKSEAADSETISSETAETVTE